MTTVFFERRRGAVRVGTEQEMTENEPCAFPQKVVVCR
jgi:hypothetical protein